MNNSCLPPRGTPDVWARMAKTVEKMPLFMYGTGNGADRILNVMESRGIPLSGVFASDGFVRNRSFRGFPVRSYSDISSENTDFAVIVAFGSSRPEVMANVDRIASEHVLYCPDVPAVGDTLFDTDLYDSNYENFERVIALFDDERSREVYSDIIKYKLTGDISFLKSSADEGDIGEGVLHYDDYRTVLDLGAYTGDTVKSAALTMPSLTHIIAVEPEARAFRKLTELVGTLPFKLTPVNAAAWDRDTTLTFTGGVGRGSTLDADGRSTHRGQRSYDVTALTPDTASDGCCVDYIKYDVEGAEVRALHGSKRLISEFAPDLLVSLYHRSEDIFDLPLLVRELCPDHRLYLRRAKCFPAWDINLYAVKEK